MKTVMFRSSLIRDHITNGSDMGKLSANSLQTPCTCGSFTCDWGAAMRFNRRRLGRIAAGLVTKIGCTTFEGRELAALRKAAKRALKMMDKLAMQEKGAAR